MEKAKIYIIIFLGAVALSSCETTKDNEQVKEKIEVNENKTNNMTYSQIDEETQNLIDGLNQAVQAGGDPDHPIEGLISKGESNAMFAEFKKRLEENGYKLEWDSDKYKLKKEE